MIDRETGEERWRYFLWLCTALKSFVDPAQYPAQTIEWPASPGETVRLVEMMDGHKISPALASILGDVATVPSEVKDHLHAVHWLNGQRNDTILAGIATIGRQLAMQGIDAIFLKGAASLVSGLYTDPATRFLGDIDLLVAPQEAEGASRALMQCGFTEIAVKPASLFPRNRHHLAMQRNPDTGVGVEIHFAVLAPMSGAALDGEALRRSAVSVSFRGSTYRVPTIEDRVLHNVIHHQITDGFYHRRSCSLRQILDLALLRRDGEVSTQQILQRRDIPAKQRAAIEHGIHLTAILGPSPDSGELVDRAIRRLEHGIRRPRNHIGIVAKSYLHELRSRPLGIVNFLLPSRWPGRIRHLRSALKRPHY
ncbi:nucleotidyltransferase family protein [Sphingopyxis macrogoltabida]|uniref:Nucleotidyltransferase family protein n=1 Tax=Sphingopyxis macrogoltabida TaxID=33050 RepID=A0AAC8YYB2_SPHMC|nr:nucleotidyltransferase family protein [Sphingopyxis macrogoltabida]ALJ12203.1 hypothetical protein LH19_04920 [Sphingopyxis macrogoltabida]AMU88377.1 hypothetical protein ATM17_04880 [Sphingopyxis macrogoltabida]